MIGTSRTTATMRQPPCSARFRSAASRNGPADLANMARSMNPEPR